MRTEVIDNKKVNKVKNDKKNGGLRALLEVKEISVILPLIILIVVAMLVNPVFLSASNVLDILRTASYSAMIAVPLTFLLASGRMDLSVAATTTLGGLVAAIAEVNGVPLVFALLLAIIVGASVGLVNSVLVEKYAMPGFIATMATSYVVRGISSVIQIITLLVVFQMDFKL